MDINSTLYTEAYMYGICGDVYDRFDYETHSTDKTMRYLYITFKTR